MPFAKKYESFEVREMLRNAEGVASPVTGAGAHSQTLHAKATPGGRGATTVAMLDRTHKRPGESNNAFKNRDGKPVTSAFSSLIHQAAAACDALNSTTGQTALAVFDNGAHVGSNIRLTLNVPVLREHGFLPASNAPSLLVAAKTAANVDRTQNTSGVRLIIDRAAGAGTMHIQTCIPLGGAAPAASWEAKDMGTSTVLANG